jgi:hypothetical protein
MSPFVPEKGFASCRILKMTQQSNLFASSTSGRRRGYDTVFYEKSLCARDELKTPVGRWEIMRREEGKTLSTYFCAVFAG